MIYSVVKQEGGDICIGFNHDLGEKRGTWVKRQKKRREKKIWYVERLEGVFFWS
jgi:hypothetical protein